MLPGVEVAMSSSEDDRDQDLAVTSQAMYAGTGDEPPPDAPPEQRLAWQLTVQADACEVMGSGLYAHLLRAAADDLLVGGPTREVLTPHAGGGRADALALRLMAAVHRLVLSGQAPTLAAHYPSVGGDGDPEAAWPAFRDLLATEPDRITELIGRPCQTNEVGRCAALLWGLLQIADTTGLPLRLLEVGTSAGLLLRFDHYRYGGAGAAWGPADSEVDLDGFWAQPPPTGTDVEVEVAERAGCDPTPVDPTSDEGLLSLRSSVWADQTQRLARLDGAVAIARRVPAEVTAASVDDWLPPRLAEPAEGVATVVYHSVVEEYLDADQRRVLHETVRAAGARASARAPLAWLRLEPISRLRHHGVSLATWPGTGSLAADGDDRVLAICGGHGADVRAPDE
jgi:hypothetical protein